MVLPSLALMVHAAARERRWELGAVPLLFLSLYVPFLAAGRPIFLYSALSILPAAFLAVGWAGERVLGRFTPVFAAAAIAWGAFLYPLSAGVPADVGLYRPILGLLERMGP